MFKLKRAYEPADAADGARYLIDRLWPHGIKRESLNVDEWLKELSPSDSLRRWFNHDPKRWDEFRQRYFAELDSKPEAWTPLAEAARSGPVTLVYSARDAEHNNGVALAEYLESRSAKKKTARHH